jgi:hypothetical protein
VFRHQLGERITVTSPPLARTGWKQTDARPFTLAVLKAPKTAELEKPFPVLFALTNDGPTPLALEVELVREPMTAGVLAAGSMTAPVGVLQRGEEKQFCFWFMAVQLGVCTVHGLCVRWEGQEHTFLALHHVLVPRAAEGTAAADPEPPCLPSAALDDVAEAKANEILPSLTA